MKSKVSSVLTCVLLLTPLTLFAASKNSQSITFSKPLTVGGTSIPAGDYKIEWEGTGNVTATFRHGKKVVATVPATVSETKSNYDHALHFKDDILQGILWKNASIEFAPSEAPQASGN